MSEYCNLSQGNIQNITYNRNDNVRRQLFEASDSAHTQQQAQDYAVNRAFENRPPEMEYNVENIPICCRQANLAAHRRVRDPTITTVPPRDQTFPSSKSRCDCQSEEYIQGRSEENRGVPQYPTQPQYNIPQYPQRTERKLDQTRNVPVGPGRNTTRNIVQSPAVPRNKTVSVQSAVNATRNVVRAAQQMRGQRYVSRPLGFEEFTQPPASNQHGAFQTYTLTPSSVGSDQYWSEDYPDLGPWRNFEIPKKLKKVNYALAASKTHPRLAVPLPSRNYSTYGDPQPIVNIREVAEHRKRAPRFYSTPTAPEFVNQGTSLSSVWGQDTGRTDSSIGWSKGVRMDSFNVYGPVTPSPRKVKGAPRAYASHIPPTTRGARIPTPHTTHTYLPDPFPPINVPYDIFDLYKTPPQTSARQPDNVRSGNHPRTPGNLQPGSGTANQTYGLPQQAVNDTYCAPCAANATYSIEAEKSDDKDESEAKKDEEIAEIGKNFCTVLEIRAPCAENPCVPEKPLQLSINVTCADPSMLVTPDKRVNVIQHVPEPRPPAVPTNRINDVPSDCRCEEK